MVFCPCFHEWHKTSNFKEYRVLHPLQQEANNPVAPYLLPTHSSPGLCRAAGGEYVLYYQYEQSVN